MIYGYLAGAALCLIGGRTLRFGNLNKKKVWQTALILAAGFLTAAFSVWIQGTEIGKSTIDRNEPGEGSQEREFLVDAKGELENYPIRLEIEEKRLTLNQKKEYLNQAKKELGQLILGDNSSLEQVTEPLHLPEYLQDGAVEASYSFSDYTVFRVDGTLEQEVDKPVMVQITAELTCQKEILLYQFYVRVVPQKSLLRRNLQKNWQILWQKKIKRKIQMLLFCQRKKEGKRLSGKKRNKVQDLS